MLKKPLKKMRQAEISIFTLKNKLSNYKALAYLLIATFACYYFLVGMGKFLNFSIPWPMDQGIFMQVLANAFHGRNLSSPIYGIDNFLEHHFSPILWVFVPFYGVFQHWYFLVFVQLLAIASTLLLILRVANHKLNPLWGIAILTIAITYLPLAHLAENGFRVAIFAMPIVTWIVLSVEKQNFRGFFCACFLLSLTREDISLMLFGVAIYAYLCKLDRKYTFCALAIGLANVICTSLFLEGVGLGNYSYLGSNKLEIILTIMEKPHLWVNEILQKKTYLYQFLAPCLFSVLLRPKYLVLGGSQWAVLLLSQGEVVANIHFWYHAPLIPLNFLALIEVFERLKNSQLLASKGPIIRKLPLVGLWLFLMWGADMRIKGRGFAEKALRGASNQFHELAQHLESIPSNASLRVQDQFLPNLNKHPNAQLFEKSSLDSDFILIEKPLNTISVELKADDYQLVYGGEGIYLYSKK